MRDHAIIAALTSIVLIAAACGPVREDPPPAAEAAGQAEDVAAIKSRLDEYLTAHNAGDATALAAIFSDDAIQMPPNRPANVGKEAIQVWLQNFYNRFTEDLTSEIADVEATGNWAFVRSIYTATLTPKAGGGQIEDSGNWLQIYRRQPGGSWKIAREIWNSHNPPPGAGQ